MACKSNRQENAGLVDQAPAGHLFRECGRFPLNLFVEHGTREPRSWMGSSASKGHSSEFKLSFSDCRWIEDLYFLLCKKVPFEYLCYVLEIFCSQSLTIVARCLPAVMRLLKILRPSIHSAVGAI